MNDGAEAYFAAQRAGVERYETAIWPRVVAVVIYVLMIAAVLFFGQRAAHAHDIYTGVHGKDGQLCCGTDDCFRTIWRENKSDPSAFDFVLPTANGKWETVPGDRITFLPVPGDDHVDTAGERYGHICYRLANDFDRTPGAPQFNHVTGDGQWVIYCAFIPPGAT